VRLSLAALLVCAALAGLGFRSASRPPAAPWSSAGAFVLHTHDVDPEWLGQQLRAAGFGWVVVYVGSTGMEQPPDANWIARFKQASGLPVGGWSWLVGYPKYDARFAADAVKQYGLSFYIANAELPYQVGPKLSAQFVATFRKLEPTLPAALSSLCDATGIGLAPWAKAGFAFLPQAYVNQFGPKVAPTACVRAALPYFPRTSVHPTVGSYGGSSGYVSPQEYVQLLAQAKTVGFSVYLADVEMTAADWQAYGQAIATMHLAMLAR
jgi:hypothetical protein